MQMVTSPSSPTPEPSSDAWLPLVYDELRLLARREIRRELEPQTLQTTALVHEAYLRLVGDDQRSWRDRAHFFGAAARAMRQILVDRARARQSLKRGGSAQRIPLEALDHLDLETDPDRFLALEESLSQLERVDERKARIVMLRYFAGLSIAQTASVMELSATTVKEEWFFARAWLFRAISARESRPS